MILSQFFNFLKLLNSETGTNQIAAGIVCGMILGFSPGLSLQVVLVFMLILLLRVQAGAAFASAGVFKIAAYALDPLFHAIGVEVLQHPALTATFSTLYHMPLVPLTSFNNSVTMGSGVVALILAAPAFFGSKMLIARYRHHIVARMQGTKLWKAVQATSLYKWYVKYEQLRNI